MLEETLPLLIDVRYLLGDVRMLQEQLKPSKTDNGDREWQTFVKPLLTNSNSTLRPCGSCTHG